MSDNNRLKRTLEFDLYDAPMLLGALRIAANTALMCGHKDAQRKLKVYGEMMKQFVPPAAETFDDEVWAEIGMALLDAKSFRVTVEPRSWERSWWSEGVLTVYVGERKFAGGYGLHGYVKRRDPEPPRLLFEALQELAPVDCVGELQSVEERV